MTNPNNVDLKAVWGAAADDVYAVGRQVVIIIGGGSLVRSSVLHYDGSSWSEVIVPERVGFESIAGTAADDIFLGGDGALLHWDGTDWARVQYPGGGRIFGMHASGPSLWMAGENLLRQQVRAVRWPCLDCTP